MSNALVKKSLELLNEGIDRSRDKKNKKKKRKVQGTLDLIPINHRLISKDKKNGFINFSTPSSTLTIQEVKQQLKSKVDPTNDNIQKLLLLSANRLNSETSEKLLARAVKKRYLNKEDKPDKEEGTAFTEEDFKKFEAEYFDE